MSARYLSKKKYHETLGGTSLARRFDLSFSYELSKCLVYGCLFNILIQSLVILFTWLNYLQIFFVNPFHLELTSGVIFNVEMSIFPYIILLNHRIWRKNCVRVLRKNPFIMPKKSTQVKSLNGQNMMRKQSQNDHFDQLKNQWLK
ncbi:unnamed protein product [Caenorhabditis angaria]|uniref:Serpentine receptor class gamma n=1 Tax=Caenorhabditis angaria TaxID=860376 RepID=A0A9P1IWF2_9PELO|nr:unnamed protein product [Caenorhabditis angaria]